MDDTNIILFPVTNRRHDVTRIAVDPEEVAARIRSMKMAFFAEVADQVVDDTLRSISVLNLEETKAETFPLESRDVILIKEAVISALCRIVGIEHPLHEIGDDNIVISDILQDAEASLFKYRFKSEPETGESADLLL